MRDHARGERDQGPSSTFRTSSFCTLLIALVGRLTTKTTRREVHRRN